MTGSVPLLCGVLGDWSHLALQGAENCLRGRARPQRSKLLDA
jgi:hypothetical protein